MSFWESISDFGSGLLGEVLKPDNILSAVGLYASNKRQSDALSASQAAAEAKMQQDIQLMNLKHQQDLELLRLKGAGGGGGGSAASLALANAELALKRKELAQQKALAKLDAKLKGKQMMGEQILAGGGLAQDAMRNLQQGATAPLLRGG